MTRASDPGQDGPCGANDPRSPRTPDQRDSSHDNSYAAGRDSTEEFERAAVLDAGASDAHGDQQHHADNPPRPIDPALIAGGDDMVGIANDMTTGPDTMGADLGGEPAPEARPERERLPREGGDPRTS